MRGKEKCPICGYLANQSPYDNSGWFICSYCSNFFSKEQADKAFKDKIIKKGEKIK